MATTDILVPADEFSRLPDMGQPSELVREAKIYFSLEAGETLLPEAIKYLGAEHFLYASDIPHWDNEFPGNLHALRNHPAVSDSDKEKILYKNAKELFAL